MEIREYDPKYRALDDSLRMLVARLGLPIEQEYAIVSGTSVVNLSLAGAEFSLIGLLVTTVFRRLKSGHYGDYSSLIPSPQKQLQTDLQACADALRRKPDEPRALEWEALVLRASNGDFDF